MTEPRHLPTTRARFHNFIAAAAISLLASLPAGAVSSTTYVNSSGTHPPGNFSTITAALKALPTTCNGACTVEIENTATYAEMVTVRNIAVTGGGTIAILALSTATVTVDPPAGAAAFVIANASVSLTGINIVPTHAITYGVDASSAYVTISGVNVIDPSGEIAEAGIVLSSWTTVAYASVTVGGLNASGFWLQGSTATSVSNSSAAATNAGSTGYAWWLNGAADNTLTGIFSSNPAGEGFVLDSSAAANAVSQSTMTSNDMTGSCALALSVVSSNTFAGDYIFNPSGCAFYVGTGSNGNNVSGSTMTGGGSYLALFLTGASSNTFTGCSINGSGSNNSVDIISSNYNTISDSTITTTGTNQTILIFSSSYNDLTHDYIAGVSLGAHVDSNSDHNTISQSYMTATAGDAAEIVNSYHNTISQSTMASASNGRALLVSAGSSGNTVSQSSMTNNASGFPALAVAQASTNTFSGDYIQGSTAVYVSQSTGIAIGGSVLVATNTAGYALHLDLGSVNLTLTTDTIVAQTKGIGIYLDKGSNGSIALTSNTVAGAADGVQIATQAANASLSIASMTFSSLAAGATAINFGGGVFAATFTAVDFADATVGANVNASALGSGSHIYMISPYGLRTGPSFSDDPKGYVSWTALPVNPTIGGVFVSSVAVSWTAVGSNQGYVLLASTGAFPDSFAGNQSSSTTNGAASGLTVLSLNPNATYFFEAGSVWSGTTYYALTTPSSTSTLAVGPATAAATFAAVATGGFTAFWSANTNPASVTSYTVVVSTDGVSFGGTPPYAVQATTRPFGPNPQYTFSGLDANTTYFLEVAAVNNDGISTAYTALGSTATLVAAPATVVTTFTAVTPVGFTARWSADGNAVSVTSYTVTISTDGVNFGGAPPFAVSAATMPAGAAPQYTFTGLNSNTVYFLEVAAIGVDGLQSAFTRLGSTQTSNTATPPVNPAVSAVYASSIAVAWAPVGANQGYVLQASTGMFPNTFAGNQSSSTTNGAASVLTVLSLNLDTTYYLEIGAVWNGTTYYALTAPASTSTLAAAPATAVTTFSAVTTSGFTAFWSVGANPPSASYLVTASTDGANFGGVPPYAVSAATAPAGANPQFTFTGLNAYATYFFEVAAVNNNGVPSAYAALGSTLTLNITAPPGSPAAAAVFVTSAVVTWTPVGADDGYVATASTGIPPNGFAGNQSSATAAGAAGALTVLSLNPNTSYYLQVGSVWNGATDYAPLNGIPVVTLAATPVAAAFSAIGPNGFTANWTPAGDPSDTVYDVEISTSINFSIRAASAATTADSAAFAGLTPGVVYYGQIRAFNRNGAPTNYTALGAVETAVGVISISGSLPPNVYSNASTATFTAQGASQYRYKISVSSTDHPTDTDHLFDGSNLLVPVSEGALYFNVLGETSLGAFVDYGSYGPMLIDQTPPIMAPVQAQASSTDPTPILAGQTAADPAPYFYWSAPSSSAPIVGYNFSVFTSASQTPPQTVTTASLFQTYAFTQSGSYYVDVSAEDQAGNWSAPVQFEYVFLGPPSATSAVPENNDFNPLRGESMTVAVQMAQAGNLKITIFTLRGDQVAVLTNGSLSAGSYNFPWGGRSSSGQLVATGVYVILVEAPGYKKHFKCLVAK